MRMSDLKWEHEKYFDYAKIHRMGVWIASIYHLTYTLPPGALRAGEEGYAPGTYRIKVHISGAEWEGLTAVEAQCVLYALSKIPPIKDCLRASWRQMIGITFMVMLPLLLGKYDVMLWVALSPVIITMIASVYLAILWLPPKVNHGD